MVYHGYCPPSFICANIIPIPKGSKANLSDSDKYNNNNNHLYSLHKKHIKHNA